MKTIYVRAWFIPAALAGALLLAFLFRQSLDHWIGDTLATNTYTLLIFLAGAGAGATITLLGTQVRDMPWMIRRLYRRLRYRERPSAGNHPPSLRAYFKADYNARTTAR